jgi:hypothetical protein
MGVWRVSRTPARRLDPDRSDWIRPQRSSFKSGARGEVVILRAILAAVGFSLASAASGGGTLSSGGTTSSRSGGTSAVVFSCDFQRSPSDCGFAEQAKIPGRATLVNLDGMRGVRLHTEPGDSNVAGSGAAERNDLALSPAATQCYEGQEQWWAHSILFPEDYAVPPPPWPGHWTWGVVFDFHQTESTGQANFHVDAMPDPIGLRFRGYGGVPDGSGEYAAVLGPAAKGIWYHFVYHVKWSSSPAGFFDAWVNGMQKLAHRGPTLYAGQQCYLKLANYHTAFGRASSVIHGRVIRGTTPSAVSLLPLQGLRESGTDNGRQ